MTRKQRDALVMEHLEWAKGEGRYLARRAGRVAPPDIDGIVNEALLEAASKYDPKKGTFRGFARLIIHGRVKDAQRGSDLLTRDERVRVRRDGSQAPRRLTPMPGDAWIPEGDGQPKHMDRRRVSKPPSQELRTLTRQLLGRIETLPPRLRFVVEETLKGRRLKEIGEDLSVSEARVSQLLSEASYLLQLDPL